MKAPAACRRSGGRWIGGSIPV